MTGLGGGKLCRLSFFEGRGDPKDDVEQRERQVFDIAPHAVSKYSKEFTEENHPPFASGGAGEQFLERLEYGVYA
ncbi:hypothetical protein LJR231_004026 [Phyllobacterium sp. LjRoot231]|uniref:hypothetical protein n=1 Tax=Phyllobacterium sp. LjRoot231 TaxID=3342289 RepID=UPI003ECD5D57